MGFWKRLILPNKRFFKYICLEFGILATLQFDWLLENNQILPDKINSVENVRERWFRQVPEVDTTLHRSLIMYNWIYSFFSLDIGEPKIVQALINAELKRNGSFLKVK